MNVRALHELPTRTRLRIGGSMGGLRERERLERAVSEIPGVRSARASAATGTLLVFHDRAVSSRALRGALASLPSAEDGATAPRRAASRPSDELRARRNALVRSLLWLAIAPAVSAVPRAAVTLVRSVPFFRAAVRELARGRVSADVLDAAAIATAIRMGDLRTAGVIALLLGLGEYIRVRTEHRARRELTATLVREERAVWARRGGVETRVSHRDLQVGDVVVLRAGDVVPVDGRVASGEASVDQSSLTGESVPVARGEGSRVYEGTAVVEGQLEVEALEVGDETRLARIVRLVHDADRAKARVESRAARLADGLVPYVFGAAALTAVATGSAARAASVLLVDYSCALKLAVPVSIKTCLSEALRGGVLIRGGKFVEALAAVDTVVFDKTGTLTRARPRVVEVVRTGDVDEATLVRDAACVEEHYAHPFAAAIQEEATRRGLLHRRELHGKVKYVVANGVVSTVGGKRIIVGSRAFLARSGVPVADHGTDTTGRSLVYVGVDDRLVGVFAIEDPVRDDVAQVMGDLRALGMKRLVLVTGDSHANARRLAQLGFDEHHAEISPEEKAAVVSRLQAEGRRVAMVGDGINDAPALSAASVGISFRHGADLARESADVLILTEDLAALPRAVRLARRTMGRVRGNFRAIAGVNSTLIGLGALGIVPAAASGVLHNATTIVTSALSLRPYGSYRT